MKLGKIKKNPFQTWILWVWELNLKFIFYLLSIYLHKNITFHFFSSSIIHLYIIGTIGFSI